MSAQFMKYPIFESLAKKFRTWNKFSPFGEIINNPHIRKIKFWRSDNTAFRPFPIGFQKSAQHGINQYLEMQDERKTIGRGTRLFFLGQKLTQFVNRLRRWVTTRPYRSHSASLSSSPFLPSPPFQPFPSFLLTLSPAPATLPPSNYGHIQSVLSI